MFLLWRTNPVWDLKSIVHNRNAAAAITQRLWDRTGLSCSRWQVLWHVLQCQRVVCQVSMSSPIFPSELHAVELTGYFVDISSRNNSVWEVLHQMHHYGPHKEKHSVKIVAAVLILVTWDWLNISVTCLHDIYYSAYCWLCFATLWKMQILRFAS